MSDEEGMEVIEEEGDMPVDQENKSKQDNDNDDEVYLPGKPLTEGEELVCDQTAYVMLHQAQTGAPCLSFDIIEDGFGRNREDFPLTAYIVAGTQAGQANVNNIIVMKLSNLHGTAKEEDDDDDDEDDESDDDDDSKNPKMAGALIKHQGCVNRIRVIYRYHQGMKISMYYISEHHY